MLRISEDKRARNSVTLRLEGQVIGPWVGELRRICEPLLKEGSKLVLDLAEVSFMDENGLVLLAGLKARGVNLVNTLPFVTEQLKTVDIVTK